MTTTSNDENESPAARSRVFAVAIRIAIPLLIIAGGIWAYSILSKTTEEEKAPEAQRQKIRTRVVELNRQNYTVTVTTQGVVQPHNQITLSVEVGGRIDSLSPAFEQGSFFDKGDVLIELDPRDYENAVDLAKAGKLGAEAALTLAQQNYDRMVKGYEESKAAIVTKAEVDIAAAERAQAESNLDAAISELEQAERDLERTTITAPFAGRVLEKSVGLGQSVASGTPLGTIFAVDYAELRLPIAARERQFLDLPERASDPALPVQITDAIDFESESEWTGKIVRTEGALDPDSLELFAIARIDDPFGLKSGNPPLRIGQPVTGMIQGHVLENVIALPRPAVRQLDRIILIDNNDLTLSTISVTPIWDDEEYVIVRNSDIPEGALLSTTHLVYAPEGSEVEIIPDVPQETGS